MRAGQVFKDNIYSCGYCRGTGTDPRNRTTCHICKGSSSNEIRGAAAHCGFCRGSGQGHSGSSVTCTVCGGKGMVSVKEPIKACPECRGWGKSGSGLSCIKCRGKGVIENVKGA